MFDTLRRLFRRIFRRWLRPPEKPRTIWERGRDVSFFYGTPGFPKKDKD